MSISNDLLDLLKRIVAWAGVIFLFYVMPFGFHFRLGKEDGRGQIEFTLGKSDNSIKIGTEF